MSDKASSLSVAVCQLTSTDRVDQNVDSIERTLSSLSQSSNLDLICFPENCLYLRMSKEESPPKLTLADKWFKTLSASAVRLKTNLHLGSVPLFEDGKLFNASVLLTADGQAEVLYRKIHLFDVDVEGAKPQRESETFDPGSGPSTFSIKGWKFGSSICYDVRFAELYTQYARLGVDVILIPSAFLVETGRAHWEILIRARAIESQAYVLAAAQGGTHLGAHGEKRATYGHSMIVDPWGEVIAEAKEPKPDVLQAVLGADKIASVRKQIPMKSHRKLV